MSSPPPAPQGRGAASPPGFPQPGLPKPGSLHPPDGQPPSQSAARPASLHPPVGAPRLQIVGLYKRYGTLPVLDGISLTVAAGEIVAVVGPSGCGKTTLLDVLAGVEPADGGALWWNGEPVANLRGRVAYMQQKDLLLPWRSALDNALLGAQIRGRLAEARQRAPELFARLGLRGFERARPAELSGGMRQRVALARTILGGGELWLLDEPFAAVDALTRRELHRLLRELWSGQPALLVTHDIHDARRLAHRVVVFSPRPARVLAELPAAEASEERLLALLGLAEPDSLDQAPRVRTWA